MCVPFAFAIKLGKTNGVKFMKLNFIHNLKMIIRYGTWNDGSRPPISFYLSPLSILLFLFRVSIIDESSKRFISKFTYTYVCTSYTRIRTAFICINYILGVKITTHIFSMNRLAVFEFARMQPADRISACVCTCIVCTNFCLYIRDTGH